MAIILSVSHSVLMIFSMLCFSFDYILLETTGLADPGPIASMFWLDAELGSDLYLDGIITLVDAKHCLAHLLEPPADGCVNAAVKQVALSDVIVLNKVDLVNDEELGRLRSEVRRISSMTSCIETNFSRVSLDAILDLNAYVDRDAHLPSADSTAASRSAFDSAHAHLDGSVTSYTVEVRSRLNTEKVDDFLVHLLWERDVSNNRGDAMHVLRLKALYCNAVGGGVVVQAVEEQYDKTDIARQVSSDECRFIFIGRNLDKSVLEKELAKCYASS